MTTFAERLPAGWRLDTIQWAPGPRITTTLSLITALDTVTVTGTDSTLEDSIDLAIQRARAFAPAQKYLGKLASCRTDADGRWIFEALDGRIAGHQDADEAARMLGLID